MSQIGGFLGVVATWIIFGWPDSLGEAMIMGFLGGAIGAGAGGLIGSLFKKK